MTLSVGRAIVAAGALTLIAGLATAEARGQGAPRAAPQEQRGRVREDDFRRADIAAVVAAELAFARAAQDEGQWTAFAEYATKDAVMFVPQQVNAQDWLKGRANPPQAVRWQPHQVWSSCDGSLAVTKGAWQRPDGSVGYFTTIWARQQRKKDGYRWVLDQGDALAAPLPAPEMIEGKVADCARAPGAWDAAQADWEANSEAAEASVGSGESHDGTLSYRYRVFPSGARDIEVFLLLNGKMEQVLQSQVVP